MDDGGGERPGRGVVHQAFRGGGGGGVATHAAGLPTLVVVEVPADEARVLALTLATAHDWDGWRQAQRGWRGAAA